MTQFELHSQILHFFEISFDDRFTKFSRKYRFGRICGSDLYTYSNYLFRSNMELFFWVSIKLCHDFANENN